MRGQKELGGCHYKAQLNQPRLGESKQPANRKSQGNGGRGGLEVVPVRSHDGGKVSWKVL